MDKGWRDFYASNEVTDEEKAMMPVFTEISDRATDLPGVPALRQLAGAGVIEIAKVLTRFDNQIEDEWRHGLIQLAAGLFRYMKAENEEKSDG